MRYTWFTEQSFRRTVDVAELAELVGGTIDGNRRVVLSGASSLERAAEGDLSFVAGPGNVPAGRASCAGCLLVQKKEWSGPNSSAIVVEEPRRSFIQAIEAFARRQEWPRGMDEGACVAGSARVSKEAHVGALSYVGAKASVGSGTVILPGAILHGECTIGRDCVVHSGAVIYPNVVIGDRVVIRGNAVIGGDGFGFDLSGDVPVRMPQLGRVIIEDDVEIGACSCVDRAALEETYIGAGAKIDSCVLVGHGAKIGRNAVIIGQTGIGGSAEIGDGCLLSGQVGVRGHRKIGRGATVLARAAVFTDVEEEEVVGGFPADSSFAWKRQVAALRRLPALVRELRDRQRSRSQD